MGLLPLGLVLPAGAAGAPPCGRGHDPFTASGLVHNLLAAFLSHRLNPFVTVWFVLYGAVMVASEALHMDLSRLPAPARMVVNLAYLVGCYKLVSPILP
jgi:hypothetical protein